jgi:hypothetical protein
VDIARRDQEEAHYDARPSGEAVLPVRSSEGYGDHEYHLQEEALVQTSALHGERASWVLYVFSERFLM